MAAVRAGDTLVVPKLDRLARSVPDARDIGDVYVRNSKRPSDGTVAFTRSELAAWIAGCQADEFDDLA